MKSISKNNFIISTLHLSVSGYFLVHILNFDDAQAFSGRNKWENRNLWKFMFGYLGDREEIDVVSGAYTMVFKIPFM